MQVIALSLVVVTVVASTGLALWVWRALSSIGEGLGDFAGIDDLHFQDRSDRS